MPGSPFMTFPNSHMHGFGVLPVHPWVLFLTCPRPSSHLPARGTNFWGSPADFFLETTSASQTKRPASVSLPSRIFLLTGTALLCSALESAHFLAAPSMGLSKPESLLNCPHNVAIARAAYTIILLYYITNGPTFKEH